VAVLVSEIQPYAKTRDIACELDELTSDAIAAKTGNLSGTLPSDRAHALTAQKKTPDTLGGSGRAGDRGRTGDVQLGKLAFYH
jgi:hypothetical protein